MPRSFLPRLDKPPRPTCGLAGRIGDAASAVVASEARCVTDRLPAFRLVPRSRVGGCRVHGLNKKVQSVGTRAGGGGRVGFPAWLPLLATHAQLPELVAKLTQVVESKMGVILRSQRATGGAL